MSSVQRCFLPYHARQSQCMNEVGWRGWFFGNRKAIGFCWVFLGIVLLTKACWTCRLSQWGEWSECEVQSWEYAAQYQSDMDMHNHWPIRHGRSSLQCSTPPLMFETVPLFGWGFEYSTLSASQCRSCAKLWWTPGPQSSSTELVSFFQLFCFVHQDDMSGVRYISRTCCFDVHYVSFIGWPLARRWYKCQQPFLVFW